MPRNKARSFPVAAPRIAQSWKTIPQQAPATVYSKRAKTSEFLVKSLPNEPTFASSQARSPIKGLRTFSGVFLSNGEPPHDHCVSGIGGLANSARACAP
jgi:hypothetical protein